MKYHRGRRWILAAWQRRMIGNSWVKGFLIVSGDISARVSQNAERWIIKQNDNIYYHQIKAHTVSQKMLKFIGWGKLSNVCSRQYFLPEVSSDQIARFMGPTWGPPGTCRPQMGPMLDPRTLLSGWSCGRHWYKKSAQLAIRCGGCDPSSQGCLPHMRWLDGVVIK